MLVSGPGTFVAAGLIARRLVAEAAMRCPQWRSDADLAEDCRIVLSHCTDRGLVDRALLLQQALSVSPPHDPRKAAE
jgi:hypothetical protein